MGTCNYDPFGEIEYGTACSVPSNYRFAGMEWDPEANLYQTWFRKYDVNQGRWMSVDPLAGSTDNPQSLDRYGYVLNDPVNLVDPFGLWIECPNPPPPGEPPPAPNCRWRCLCDDNDHYTCNWECGPSGNPFADCTIDGIPCYDFLGPTPLGDELTEAQRRRLEEFLKRLADLGLWPPRPQPPQSLVRRQEPPKFHPNEYWGCVAGQFGSLKTIMTVFGGVSLTSFLVRKGHPIWGFALTGAALVGRTQQIRDTCIQVATHP